MRYASFTLKLTAVHIAMMSLCLGSLAQTAESELPYRTLPEHPESYTAESVASRMIDGLGFRYYWATEGLRQEDLDFRPSQEARSSFETLLHIYDLTAIVRNAIEQKPNTGSKDNRPNSYEELRKATLYNLWAASEMLKSGRVKLEDCNIISQRGEDSIEYPFWNAINGPIADALWHCGQVVSFRRSSGNPFSSKVNLLTGKVRE